MEKGENYTSCHAQIRANFYPKFENEKTDKDLRARMIDMVSKGLATLDVGVFVLSRMFREAWGTKALKKEGDFNDFLENGQLSWSIYLSEAEPFLEQYAKRSPKNQVLIGSAGNLVRTEDFLAIVDGDLVKKRVTPATPEPAVKEAVQKDEGLIVFFPGIPGCAKSSLCRELLNTPGGFGDDRPVHTLMGDLVKVADERRKKSQSILLADKNAPNEDLWRQNRKEFESELIERFGSLVKMPLLKSDRSPLPDTVKSVLEEGLDLFQLHSRRHGSKNLQGRYQKLTYNLSVLTDVLVSCSDRTYAAERTKWEKQLRSTLVANSEHLSSVQVPFEFAVQQLVAENPRVRSFLQEKKSIEEKLERAHVTLAHKCYGQHLNREVLVELTELIFNDKMAALTAHVGSVDGETIVAKNEWPHIALWTAEGVTAKEANTLPQLYADGKASHMVIDPLVSISGPLVFF
ncbi:hypothetical protein EUTSA_v10023078mg [Eutrema salsugineum]|uniref:Uncharacterized protein n=1 Tax=Eutrema salsugineum TaxID=72664 RepID=V4M3I8_EUTSA|nr:hypothetical protein EUTSA_v10023078mg [Eutrema salsugineum]